LTNEELDLPQLFPSREAFSEQFLRGGDHAIRLAAQSSECCVSRFLAPSLGKQDFESLSSVISRTLLLSFPRLLGF
jgi:thyroglobulin